ncbi:255_t:CDS:2 [Scutellospora calospora]|uniref:255_t:CDS:1 n=1 Tax=Scutellospora calospora TaxID=85575 RepID=A0ACA9KIF3_9GLOM|nr:255_t:CDS:2 [Scutellospora calospora]
MKLLSAASYPTMGDIRLVFLGIQDHLSTYMEQSEFSQKTAATSIYQKIEEYWVIMDKSSIVSTVLDPRAKLKIFDKAEAISAKKKKLRNKLKTEESSVSNYIDDEALKELLVTNELDRYVALEIVEEDIIPLDYIQATSIICEQAYLIASNTISRTRNCLHSETARACLCVKS